MLINTLYRRYFQMAAVLAFMLYSCTASVTSSSSGTIIVVRFYDERVLVGADSRGSGAGIEPKDPDKDCKITLLGEKMVFVMSGKTKTWDDTDRKFIVDAHAAAKQAFKQVSSAPNTAAHVKDVADRWAKIMISEYTRLSGLNRDDFVGDVSYDNLAQAVFVGTTSDGALVAYIVYMQSYFSPDDEPMPRTKLVPHVIGRMTSLARDGLGDRNRPVLSSF